MAFRYITPNHIEKPRRRVNRVFIHCTAADNTGPAFEGLSLVRTVDRWHRKRGWSGVGYHFMIDKDGKLMTGRSISKTPAAQGGNNTGTIAICVHGLEEGLFNAYQFETLQDLCTHLNDIYYESLTFHGHCEVSAKTCPVFDYKAVLGLDKHGRLGI